MTLSDWTMYIIIVGAGEVGAYLARIFVEEHHDVAVVEQDEKLARDLESGFDALIVAGNGVDIAALERAGIHRADLVLAVTQVDEVNLITCMTAARIGTKPRTVARVREAGYLGGDKWLTAREMGVTLLVGPERAVADEVVSLLLYEGAGQQWPLANSRLSLLELPLSEDSPLVHETLAELRAVLPAPSLIAAVAGGQGLRIPHGSDQLNVNERAYVLTLPRNVDEFVILSGKPWHHVRHVLIIGCGKIGFYLAQELEQRKLFPTIVDIDRERCEYVAGRLKKSIVLRGDGTDPELMKEQMEERSDAVVVLLEDDEKSLVTGILAKQMGAKKVIVRSDKRAHQPIAHSLGIDAALSPRRAVADAILRFVRQGKIASALMLGDHEGEIIELKVPTKPSQSAIVVRPLREVDFPSGAILGAVVRDSEVFIATGDTQILPGDELLVVTLPRAIRAVEALLG